MLRPVIELRGEINGALAASVKRQFANLHVSDPVTVRIDSEGGQPAGAVEIARLLRARRGHTIGHAVEQCDSAAIIVLAACRSRYGGPDMVFRMHTTASCVAPKVAGRATATALRVEAERLDRLDAIIQKYLAICIGCRAAEVAELE